MDYASASDGELVAACRGGDEGAWRELVERFSRYVYAITRAYRLADADAEDVFQEAFTRIYEHLDRLRDDEAIRPWIGQLCRRLCVDRLRSGTREQASETLEDEPELDHRLAMVEDAVSVRAAMGELSPECRDILDRFFCRDESYHTIGTALQLPPGTIASRISRCLARLREKFVGRSAVRPASRGT